jgi:hypothetical protein
MLNRDQFIHFLDHEVKRAQRYQNCFCLLVIRIEPLSEGFKDGIEGHYQRIRGLIAEEVRESDLTGVLEESRMAILLPYADPVAGGQAKSRLEQTLRYYNFENEDFRVMIQKISFPMDGTNTAGILEEIDGPQSTENKKTPFLQQAAPYFSRM